jgi:hypothetical protein
LPVSTIKSEKRPDKASQQDEQQETLTPLKLAPAMLIVNFPLKTSFSFFVMS